MCKLTFGKTRQDRKRIKSFEERLDAAVAESRRLSSKMEQLAGRNERQDLGSRQPQPSTRSAAHTSYPGDDTVH